MRLVFGLILLYMLSGVQSQQREAYINFEKTAVHLGRIMESDGIVFDSFAFNNTGSVPLVIKNIITSCGCTNPYYSKEPILPGHSGYVKAAYNPKDRPGAFDVKITVNSSASNYLVVLSLKGEVIPRARTTADLFPIYIEGLRLKTNSMNFQLLSTAKAEKVIEVHNPYNKDLAIEFDRVPEHIKVQAIPNILKFGKTGIIKVQYDAKHKNDFGTLADRLYLVINGVKHKKNYLSITADITEDFGILDSLKKQQAPRIKIDNQRINFGTIREREIFRFSVHIKNEGLRNLIIRKAVPSCGCTIVKTEGFVVPPGGEEKMDIVFDSTGRHGQQSKTITVISNDPAQPKTVIYLTGVIME